MSEETTTEQLAEIEGQPKSTPASEYTPPDGWRVLEVGEPLKGGDEYHAGLNGYIRRIEPQPQPQPQPEPESDTELQAQVAFLKGREVTLGTRLQQEREVTTRLRSEVSYVQNLLGTERQRVTQLEELVGSLRTINEAQEKTVKLAGQENTDLQHRLSVVADQWWEQTCTINGLQQQLESVKAELVAQAETIRRLQIELDAAQQVPQAVSDRFEEGWDAGTARAVETVAEWTEPFRTCGSERLALAVMANLPHIMRTLTGLTPED